MTQVSLPQRSWAQLDPILMARPEAKAMRELMDAAEALSKKAKE